MDNLAKLIEYRIKEVRKEKGLRQEDMESLGINYRYYQKIEIGQANITLGTIEKVAKALDVDAKLILPRNNGHFIKRPFCFQRPTG